MLGHGRSGESFQYCAQVVHDFSGLGVEKGVGERARESESERERAREREREREREKIYKNMYR